MRKLLLYVPPILPWYCFSPAEVLWHLLTGSWKLVLDIAPEKVAYSVKYGKQQLLEDSRLGFEFDSGEFRGRTQGRERYKGGK